MIRLHLRPPRALAAATALAALLGCAAPATSTVRAPTSGKDPLVCEDEVPLGSHIPERVCRRASDIEQTRRLTRDELDRARRANDLMKD